MTDALLDAPLRARFRFEWGDLGDHTAWVRLPSGQVMRVGEEALRLVLDLDAGRTLASARDRYRLEAHELDQLLAPFVQGGAILEDALGKVVRATPVEDESVAHWWIPALLLLALHGEYLATYAHTTILTSWRDGLLVIAACLAAAVVHELGHYLASIRWFRPGFGFTWLGWFPAVYADTQEAWTLPRGIRLRINAAGVMTDLIVNTGAILLAVSTPGLEYFVTPFLLAQMSRWAITLNPFFDGDGYWLLADGLGITNLRSYAQTRLAEGRRDVFSLYALVSLALGALSLVGLLLLIWNFLGNLLVSAGVLGPLRSLLVGS